MWKCSDYPHIAEPKAAVRQEAAVMFSHQLYIFVGLSENTAVPTQMAQG